jgi:cholesterol transport system auxiliary component
MTFNLRPVACLALGLISTFAAGCGMSRPYPEKTLFAVDPGQAPKVSRPVSPGTVLIRSVYVASPFDAQTFFYRRGGSQYELDYYNGFVAAPAQLLTGSLLTWMGQSGLFAAVVESGSRMTAQYVLEGNVMEMYGDYSEPKAPKARMAVSFFLLDVRPVDAVIVFQKSYHAAAPISGAGPEAMAAAVNAAYRSILVELTGDLGGVDYAAAPVPSASTGRATTQPASSEPTR